MTWMVEVLGLPGIQRWAVSALPSDPTERDRQVQRRFTPWKLSVARDRGRHVVYIARPHSAAPVSSSGPALSLITTTGPDAGRVAPLSRAGLTTGRGRSQWRISDPSAPSDATHFSAGAAGILTQARTPTPTDVAEPDDHRLRLGDTALDVSRGAGTPLSDHGASVEAEIDVSAAPSETSPILPIVMAVGPILIGLILAVTTGHWFFLVFGLLSVIATAVMLTLQRRDRRAFGATVQRRAQDRAAARARALPDPAQIVSACRSTGSDRFGLASRHDTAATPAGGSVLTPSTSADDSGPVLLWGTARGEMGLSGAASHTGRWAWTAVCQQPAVSTLARTGVRVSGEPGRLAPVTRWVLFQLLLTCARDQRALVVKTPRRTLTLCPDDSGEMPVSAVLECADGPWLDTVMATFTGSSVGLPCSACDDATGAFDPTTPRIRMGAPPCDDVSLKGDVTAEDHIDLTSRQAHLVSQGQHLSELQALGISPTTLAWWCEELAFDLRQGRELGDQSTLPLQLPEQLADRSAVDRLEVPLTGTSGNGTPGVTVDLVADGPHMLIAGTTGSGKSDLLLSLLVGACAGHAPAEVALVLLDFKGGASFGCLEQLPHTMSVETNHVDATSLRALDAISAELRRREKLFAEHRVSDYRSFRRRHPQHTLPRLVVAIDELKVLMEEHSEAAGVLQRLAATGRSLGFHLVMATQRATGTVTADIRSNLGSVLCLRTATEQESWDLLGSSAAAKIPADRPGTVLHARPGEEPHGFRASPWVSRHAEPQWTPWGEAAAQTRPTDWDAVIAELTDDLTALKLPVPAAVVSPALPEAYLPPHPDPGDTPTVALRDDTAEARHVPVPWPRGAAGGTAWLIDAPGGRTPVLSRLLTDLAVEGRPMLVLDGLGLVADAADGLLTRHKPIVPDDLAQPEAVQDFLTRLRDCADADGTLLVTGWTMWASIRVDGAFHGLDDEILRFLACSAGQRLRVAAIGGRDLAVSRLLPHLPRRFYVPAGMTSEARMPWPRLIGVPALPGRAVYVSPEHPEPGVPAQLAMLSDASEPSGPASVTGLR